MAHYAFTPTKDAGGESGAPNFQKGAVDLDVGYLTQAYRSWLHFDLSSIPAGVLQAAYLYLSVQSTQGTDGLTLLRLHRLSTTAWVELETTWIKASNILNWSTAGGDFDPTLYVEFPMTASTGTDAQVVDIMSLVQDALLNRGSQLHLLLKRVTESGSSLIFYKCKEGPFSYQAPRVEIEMGQPRHLLETLDSVLIAPVEYGL